MDVENRGALQLVALAGAVVVILGVAAVAGIAINDSNPTGAEVLSDVEDRYQSAGSILVEANVTAEHNDTVTRFTVHSVSTDDGQFRMNISNGSEYVLMGQTENTSWLTESKSGATQVVSSGDLAEQASMTGFGGTALPGYTASEVGPENESISVVVYGLENATLDPEGDSWIENESFGGINTSMDSMDWNDNRTHPKDIGLSQDGMMAHNFSDGWTDTHGLNRSAKPHELENKSISTILEETNLSAEFVETTITGDQEVNVVEITHPERQGVLKVWATTETATVVKYQVSTPNMTKTTDIEETRFNVSPTQSTFQPPIVSQTDRASADTLEELQNQAPFPVSVPSDDWKFTGGSIIASPTEAVIGQYESNGSRIAVIQSTSPTFDRISDEGRMVEVGSRNVTITEIGDDRTIARWSQNDQSVMVAGDVAESELLEFVRGLEVSS